MLDDVAWYWEKGIFTVSPLQLSVQKTQLNIFSYIFVVEMLLKKNHIIREKSKHINLSKDKLIYIISHFLGNQ